MAKLTKAKLMDDGSKAYYNGKIYKIYDAFESPGSVNADDYKNNATYPYVADVIVVDQGKDAGRLRYGVYVTKTDRRI